MVNKTQYYTIELKSGRSREDVVDTAIKLTLCLVGNENRNKRWLLSKIGT